LFGKKRPPPPATSVNNSGSVTVQETGTAIAKLRDATETLEKREEHLCEPALDLSTPSRRPRHLVSDLRSSLAYSFRLSFGLLFSALLRIRALFAAQVSKD